MKNVLLVFGGKSYEHDISVVTASQIFNKTKLENVKLIPLYLTRNNEFYIYTESRFNIKDFSILNFKNNKNKFKKVAFVSGENNRLFIKSRFGLKEYLFADSVIFACHGEVGENGILVSFFNMFGFGTSAGSVNALSVCMNKYIFKQVMKGLKVPVVSGFKISKNEFENKTQELKYKIRFLKFPIIIKSNSGGSSIGLFVAKTRDEFDEKLKLAFEFDYEVLIEKFIANAREFNVAVLGTKDDFIVSNIDEPLKANEVLSFADKYLNSNKTKGVKGTAKNGSMATSLKNKNLNLREDLVAKIKTIAGKIFSKIGLSGVVRIDFLYDEKTGKIFVCEVNAIPGSLAFYFFKENKISTNYLVKNLVKIAEDNRLNFNDIKKEYLTNILDWYLFWLFSSNEIVMYKITIFFILFTFIGDFVL